MFHAGVVCCKDVNSTSMIMCCAICHSFNIRRLMGAIKSTTDATTKVTIYSFHECFKCLVGGNSTNTHFKTIPTIFFRIKEQYCENGEFEHVHVARVA